MALCIVLLHRGLSSSVTTAAVWWLPPTTYVYSTCSVAQPAADVACLDLLQRITDYVSPTFGECCFECGVAAQHHAHQFCDSVADLRWLILVHPLWQHLVCVQQHCKCSYSPQLQQLRFVSMCSMVMYIPCMCASDKTAHCLLAWGPAVLLDSFIYTLLVPVQHAVGVHHAWRTCPASSSTYMMYDI